MATLKPKLDKLTRFIRHHWDARAATFDDEPGHGLHSHDQREAWLDLLSRLAGGSPQRVLDVGCGTGVLALLLAELGHTVTGIDFAPQMLNRARQKAQQAQLTVQFLLENAASLSDPDGRYDLVVARHVVWTLPDPARGVREWLRVLRPGGRLAVIEGKWSPDESKADHSTSSKITWTALMRVAGRIIYYGTRPTQWAFVLGKLHHRRYEQGHTQVSFSQLPFYGGPSAERLVAFLEAQGLHDVTVEPLMRPVLWGEVPQHPRFLCVGRR